MNGFFGKRYQTCLNSKLGWCRFLLLQNSYLVDVLLKATDLNAELAQKVGGLKKKTFPFLRSTQPHESVSSRNFSVEDGAELVEICPAQSWQRAWVTTLTSLPALAYP